MEKKQKPKKGDSQRVYLSFVEKHLEGFAPGSVTLIAGLAPLGTSDDNIKTKRTYILETPQTPREVLTDLENKVYSKIKERPSARDMLEGRPDENKPKWTQLERRIGYLAEGGWPKKGESKEQAETRAEEATISRNRALFEVYESFAQSRSLG